MPEQTVQILEKDFAKLLLRAKTTEEMVVAIQLAAGKLPDDNSSGTERARYFHALLSVAIFLHDEFEDPSTANWLRELASALADLDTGTVRRFLQPVKIGGSGNRLDDSATWRARANVSLAFDALRAAGATRKTAAEYIIKKAPWIRELTASTKPERALVSWRDALRKGRVKNAEGQAVYSAEWRRIEVEVAKWPVEVRLGNAKRLVEPLLRPPRI